MSLINGPGYMTQGQAQKDSDFYPYEIDNSIWLDGASDYLHRTPTATGNRQKFSYSFWMKRCAPNVIWEVLFGADDGTYLDYQSITNTNSYYGHVFDDGVAGAVYSTDVYLDSASWYHIFVIVDTTQATGTDRIKMWTNGLENSLTFSTNVTLNYSSSYNLASTTQYIGRQADAASNFVNGYLTEVHWLDGNTTATVDDFGEFKEDIWIPKQYTGGGYGTNGYYLNFSNSSDLGEDFSGNNNDFTLTSITSTNQPSDTPTDNYPTGSYELSSAPTSVTNGNLTLIVPVADSWSQGDFQTANVAFPDSGSWYLELFVNAVGTMFFGVTDPNPVNYLSDCCVVYLLNGNTYEGLVNTGAYASASTTNDYIGLRADCDEGELEFYINGVSQGTYSFDPSGKVVCMSDGSAANSCTGTINFGQNAFQYSIPSGSQTLSFNNYPITVVPSDAFVANLRLGTGAVANVDVGIAPDLVWIKNRDQADPNNLVDTVRGATYEINSDGVAGGTDLNGLTAFTSTGFTLGTGANGYNAVGENHVDWCWKKGSAYGFDIVTYTGNGGVQSVSHNLGVAPSWMMVKCTSLGYAWGVYTDASGPTKALNLDLANNVITSHVYWGNTAPTSTEFTVSSGTSVNSSGQTYVGYLFAEMDGYCKTGSYIGTGVAATGPFVYCGFRPAFIIIRGFSTRSWMISDSARDPDHNLLLHHLYADLPDVEYNTNQHAYTSTGFYIRNTWAQLNSSGIEYAYMAFAEFPLQHVNAR